MRLETRSWIENAMKMALKISSYLLALIIPVLMLKHSSAAMSYLCVILCSQFPSRAGIRKGLFSAVALIIYAAIVGICGFLFTMTRFHTGAPVLSCGGNPLDMDLPWFIERLTEKGTCNPPAR